MKNILIDDSIGRHNLDLQLSSTRIKKAGGYKDQSVVCIMANRDEWIHLRIANNWFNLMTPMNQKYFRIPVLRMEIGAAYNETFQQVVNHPELGKWKYILTLESDNMPPADGLLRLLEDMEEIDIVSGIYWTKGENGQPMIYGDPNIVPLNFWPQLPKDNQLQRCNGLGMGFTLFKMDIFKDSRLTLPWFKTLQGEENGKSGAYTQDLYFFEKVYGLGYKVACDTRVRVGHYDPKEDIVW